MRRLKTFGAVSRSHPFGGAPCGVCVDGFNNTTRYEDLAAASAPGAAVMSRVTVFRILALPTATQSIMSRVLTSAPRGWDVRGAAGPIVNMFVVNAALGGVASPNFVPVAGNVGKTMVLFHTADATTAQLLKAFSGAGGTIAEIGAPGTALVGYTGPNVADHFAIGNSNAPTGNTRPFAWGSVFAVAGSDTTAWSVAQMQAILDDVRANCGRITVATPGEAFRYNAPDVFPPNTWPAAAGATLTLQGATQSLVVRTRCAPVFL